MKQQLTFTNPETAIKLTESEAINLGIDINQDQIHGDLKTFGVWNIPVSYKAICTSSIWAIPENGFTNKRIETTIYGKRTMNNVRQGGYELEGYVSVNGKKYSAFTSSQLFEVNGKLIDVAVIHARIK